MIARCSKPCCLTFSLAMRKSCGFQSSKALARISRGRKLYPSIQHEERLCWSVRVCIQLGRPHDEHSYYVIDETLCWVFHSGQLKNLPKDTAKSARTQESVWVAGGCKKEIGNKYHERRHHVEAELMRLYKLRGRLLNILCTSWLALV